MSKKLLVSLLGLGLLSSSFAGPFSLKHAQVNQNKQAARQQASTEEYADFNGVWKGQCEPGNISDDGMERLVIEHDLYNISINNQDYQVGSLNSEMESSSFSSDGMHLSFKWSTDKSMLQFNGVGYDISFSSDQFPPQAEALESILLHGQLRRQDDHLHFDAKFQMFQDGHAMGAHNIHCRYSKVDEESKA